jgi:hypothetical protein
MQTMISTLHFPVHAKKECQKIDWKLKHWSECSQLHQVTKEEVQAHKRSFMLSQ